VGRLPIAGTQQSSSIGIDTRRPEEGDVTAYGLQRTSNAKTEVPLSSGAGGVWISLVAPVSRGALFVFLPAARRCCSRSDARAASREPAAMLHSAAACQGAAPTSCSACLRSYESREDMDPASVVSRDGNGHAPAGYCLPIPIPVRIKYTR
jgi:hypothetical protein